MKRKKIELDYNIYQCKKCGRFMKIIKRTHSCIWKYCSNCNVIYKLKVKEGVI